MIYGSEPPLVLRTARRPNSLQDRRLNLIAALVIALLAVALALSPPAASTSQDSPIANYGD